MKTDTLGVRLEMLVDDYTAKNNLEKEKPVEKQGVLRCGIILEKIKLEFVYNKKAKAEYPISTLSCRVYLKKDDTFFFEMSEIIDYLGAYDFHCYYFPYIESEERMDACFNYITDAIEYNIDEINNLSALNYKYKKIKLDEIKEVFDIETSELSLFGEESEKQIAEIDSYVSSFIIGRFTTGKAYLAFLENDFETALKEYEKMSKLTNYEKKLVEFIKERFAPYQAIAVECASVLEIKSYTSKDDVKYFITALVATVGAFYFLFILLNIFVNIHYKQTTLFAVTINPFLPSLWAILPSIFAMIAFKDKIVPFFRKDRKKARAFYELLNDSKEKKKDIKKYIAFGIALFIAIIMFADYAQPTFKLYYDKMCYNSHAKPFNHYAEYTADEFIDVVALRDKELPKVETLEDLEKLDNMRKHYVIVLKSEQYIDIDEFHLSEKRTEELIEILRGEKSGSIKSADYLEDFEEK